MQATHSDIFAQKKSGLDAFLYADVGCEANGSSLTILSVLARRGKDPWAEAARWAALPRAAVIEALTQSISEMPLTPAAHAGARDCAARLVQLLPTHTPGVRQGASAKPGAATPILLPLMMLYFALAVGMAMNLLLVPKPSHNVPPAPSQLAASPLSRGAAVAGSP